VAAGDAKGKPLRKHEIFAVGPYLLGELYQNRKEGEPLRDSLKKGSGPAEDDLIKSFNDTRLYVVDRRVLTDAQTWDFDSAADGYPKLAVEGTFYHELKDSRGREFTIQVVEVALRGTGTAHFKIPNRTAHVLVTLRISGSLGFLAATATYNLDLGRCVAHYVTGDKRQPDLPQR
jgi:hypothetical protein